MEKWRHVEQGVQSHLGGHGVQKLLGSCEGFGQAHGVLDAI